MPTNIKIGMRFGRLVVSSSGRGNKNNGLKWVCTCDCGGTKMVISNALISGKTQSCGCLYMERRKFANYRHGQAKKTSEYMAWTGIKTRCNNPKSTHYEDYGGRGITVCDRWLESFDNFFNDMGEKPHPKMSIDRIDCNKGYSPENCKWATWSEQARNRRNSVLINFDGIVKPLADWCELFNVPYSTIKARHSNGWKVDINMFTAKFDHRTKKYKSINGEPVENPF